MPGARAECFAILMAFSPQTSPQSGHPRLVDAGFDVWTGLSSPSSCVCVGGGGGGDGFESQRAHSGSLHIQHAAFVQTEMHFDLLQS